MDESVENHIKVSGRPPPVPGVGRSWGGRSKGGKTEDLLEVK